MTTRPEAARTPKDTHDSSATIRKDNAYRPTIQDYRGAMVVYANSTR